MISKPSSRLTLASTLFVSLAATAAPGPTSVPSPTAAPTNNTIESAKITPIGSGNTTTVTTPGTTAAPAPSPAPAPLTTSTTTPAPAVATPPPPVPPQKEVKVTTNKASKVKVDVGFPPVYGRSPIEYFYTPIVGINYVDVTQIASNFVVPERRWLANTGNNINVNNTSLGATVGILVDGQYQITATDYWRGGFQSGLIYTSEAESNFKAEVCLDSTCSNPSTNYIESGSFASSSFILPVLFTFSHYARSDQYIVTFKLGATVSFQRYAINFEGFDIAPTREFQAGIGLGIDGRFRIPQSDQFVLIGFNTGNPFAGNGNSFSGVDILNSFLVYIGYSFS